MRRFDAHAAPRTATLKRIPDRACTRVTRIRRGAPRYGARSPSRDRSLAPCRACRYRDRSGRTRARSAVLRPGPSSRTASAMPSRARRTATSTADSGAYFSASSMRFQRHAKLVFSAEDRDAVDSGLDREHDAPAKTHRPFQIFIGRIDVATSSRVEFGARDKEPVPYRAWATSRCG